jgi:hypothetical protein
LQYNRDGHIIYDCYIKLKNERKEIYIIIIVIVIIAVAKKIKTKKKAKIKAIEAKEISFNFKESRKE